MAEKMSLAQIMGIEHEAERVDLIYRHVFHEEGRLSRSQAARVEFLTTIRMVEKDLQPGSRILDLRAGGFEIREEVTSDGLSELMADTINAMSEAAYAQYLRWHFYMSGQPGFLSAGNHLLFQAVKA